MIKKLVLLITIISSLLAFSYAKDSSWTIIPETSSWGKASKAVQEVWDAEGGKVWETYNKKAEGMDVWDSFASWIFSWNTILDFLVHIANTLSQIWLVIWAWMIIYAWYKYATWVFTGDANKWWKDAIKWAIYWVLIVIFSYTIMKVLLWMFW